MNNILEYKNYHARIEFDEEDMLFVGEVFGIQDSLNFHGTSIPELVESFHQSIDDYLEFCKEIGKNPDKEFKGTFNVRIDPELHREVAVAAEKEGTTLNKYVENAIRSAVNKEETGPIYVISQTPMLVQRREPVKGTLSQKMYIGTKKQYEQKGVIA